MKAIIRERYGPDMLTLGDVERPAVEDDGVLVRVRASSINRVDWYDVNGTPWIARPMTGLRGPKSRRLGGDFAGTVEAVGRDVADVQPGDDVFGRADGSYAECVSAQRTFARKPASVTFEEAAAVPIAGVTALQAIRDHGRLQRGQHVLVNGASGGVGTFSVQIARALGAEVTAVCSTSNVEQARLLGAHHVVDYTRDDFTRTGARYDLMLDIAGSRSWSACGRVLGPRATMVLIGGPKRPLLGPLGHIAKVRLAALAGRRQAIFFVAKLNRPDLETLGDLLESGEVKSVVERVYELGEVADAIRYMGDGHARGKVVVRV